jgi:hypothetical protein
MATAMSLLVDEAANALLGLTPPPGQFPLAAHLRGFAAHLVYGTTLGLLLAAGRDDD